MKYTVFLVLAGAFSISVHSSVLTEDWTFEHRSRRNWPEGGLALQKSPSVRGISPKPEILALLENLDSDRISADLKRISSLSSREYRSPELHSYIAQLESQIFALGYQVIRQCFEGDRACNLIAEKKGKSIPDEVILAMAHIDSVGHPQAGANDNASGSAALIEMARVFALVAPSRTVRFLFTSGEERGMLGSRHYVDQLNAVGRSRIKLAINMDMIGETRANKITLETDRDQQSLADWFAALAVTYTQLTPQIAMPAWGSDHVPFLRAGIPSLLTIDDVDVQNPCYHRACDTESRINYAYMLQVIRLNVAAMAEKAGL